MDAYVLEEDAGIGGIVKPLARVAFEAASKESANTRGRSTRKFLPVGVAGEDGG